MEEGTQIASKCENIFIFIANQENTGMWFLSLATRLSLNSISEEGKGQVSLRMNSFCTLCSSQITEGLPVSLLASTYPVLIHLLLRPCPNKLLEQGSLF